MKGTTDNNSPCLSANLIFPPLPETRFRNNNYFKLSNQEFLQPWLFSQSSISSKRASTSLTVSYAFFLVLLLNRSNSSFVGI
jgi:hypothetical protein